MANDERKNQVASLLEHAQQIGVQLQKDVREAHELMQDLRETVREAKKVQSRMTAIENIIADRLDADNKISREIDKHRIAMARDVVRLAKLYKAVTNMYNIVMDRAMEGKDEYRKIEPVSMRDIVTAIFGEDIDLIGIVEIPNDDTST